MRLSHGIIQPHAQPSSPSPLPSLRPWKPCAPPSPPPLPGCHSARYLHLPASSRWVGFCLSSRTRGTLNHDRQPLASISRGRRPHSGATMDSLRKEEIPMWPMIDYSRQPAPQERCAASAGSMPSLQTGCTIGIGRGFGPTWWSHACACCHGWASWLYLAGGTRSPHAPHHMVAP